MTTAQRRVNALRKGIARRRKELAACGKRLVENKRRLVNDVSGFIAEEENATLARREICLNATIELQKEWLRRTVDEVKAAGDAVPASDSDSDTDSI